MTFEAKAAKLSRKPLHIVKIEMDTPNESGGDYLCDFQSPLGQTFHPCIEKIDVSPAKLVPGKIGTFGSISVTIQNFKFGNGTYFGKLIGNNPYFLDRTIRLFTGFYDQSEAFSFDDFLEQKFIIRSIDGPDTNGRVTINGNSIFAKLEAEDAVYPRITFGELQSTITASQTGWVDIGNIENFPDTVAWAIINNNEVIRYNGTDNSNRIYITHRHLFNTQNSAQEAGGSVRLIGNIDNLNALNFVYTLISEYTAIDETAHINLSQWVSYRDMYLPLCFITRLVIEPTPVKDLINEICESTFCSLFEKENTGLIVFESMGVQVNSVMTLTCALHILRENHTIKRDLTKAITDVWVWYSKINKIGDDENSNFYAVQRYLDNVTEAEYNFSKVLQITAGWLGADGGSTALRIAQRQIALYHLGELIIKFRLDARDSNRSLGDQVVIDSEVDEDPTTGLSTARSYMIVKKEKINPGAYAFEAVATGFSITFRGGVIAPVELAELDYADATPEQIATYIFIADSTGHLPDGSTGYTIQ